MRKIIVLSFMTLDGVMQAPGGPDEDTSDGFKYGRWTAPYFYEADEEAGEFMAKQMKSADLLLGRKTFEIFAFYWPEHADMWPGINDVTKYVMSSTMEKSDWKNSVFLKSVEDIEKLKKSEGSPMAVDSSRGGGVHPARRRARLVSRLFRPNAQQVGSAQRPDQ